MCNSNGYIVWRYATSKLFCDVLFNFCILSSRIDMPLYMYYFAKLLHTHALRFKLLLVFLYLALYILLKLINNSTRKSRKFKRKVSANRRKITNLCLHFVRKYRWVWEACSIKHSKVFILWFLIQSSWLKKTRLRLVFSTFLSVFTNQRKNTYSCLN